jgi:WD repeat-containing protein mio
LYDFLASLTEEAIQMGDIDAILLTGVTTKGLDLMEQYINRTGDLQTIALALAVLPQKLHEDERAIMWIEL